MSNTEFEIRSGESQKGNVHSEQMRSRSAPRSESALLMASEQLTSVVYVPFDAYLCWKLIEDSKKAGEAHLRGGTSEEQRGALRQVLLDDLKLVESSKQIKQTAAETVKEGLKNAALFLRSKGGLWGAVSLFVLDEWKPVETPRNQISDVALGAAKGLGMQAVFRYGAHLDPCMRFVPMHFNLPLRATALGATARITSVGLTRETWIEQSTGRLDPAHGVKTIVSCAMNPLAICTDAATFGLSAGFSKGLNKVTNGGTERSPLLATVILGGAFGFSTGAAQETFRQREAREQLDLARIAAGGLIQGLVDATTAVPGGRQAEKEALRIYNSLNLSSQPAKAVPDWTVNRTRADNATGTTSQLVRREDGFRHPSYPDAAQAANGLHGLTIQPPREQPVMWKFNRLVDHTSSMEHIDKPNPEWSGEASTEGVFRKNAVITTAEPVRIYELSGHDCELMIPEGYAQKLDPVRRQRLLAEIEKTRGGATSAAAGACDAPLPRFVDAPLPRLPHAPVPRFVDAPLPRLPHAPLPRFVDARYKARALPEDLVPILDALPNSKLVKRINMLDSEYAYNKWFSMNVAATARDRTITFYQASNSHRLRTTTNHEWAHVLHNVRPDLLNRYVAAVHLENGLEKTGYNLDNYARKNERENWAVHLGESMLDFDADGLLKFGRNAPLRASVLGRALKSAVTEGPQAETSLFRKQFEVRADFIDAKFRPLALSSLLESMQRSNEPTLQQLELLGFLGNESHVSALRSLGPKAQTKEVANGIIDCGTEILAGKPLKQFKFLWDMSARKDPDPGHRIATAAHERFTADQIERYYKPELSKMERILGPDNESVAKRSHTLAEWYQHQQQFEDAEAYARRAHMSYVRLYGQSSIKTGAAASVLANALEEQGRYADALPYRTHSMEAAVANYGEHDRSVREHLQGLEALYERLGRLEDQESCLTRLLANYEREFGSDPNEACWIWDKLSGIYSRRYDYERSEEFAKLADAARDALDRR